MRRVHRWGLVVSAVLAVLVAITAAPDRVAAQRADNGLEERSVNSFELDPTRGVVRVTIDIDLRNVTTDRVEGDTLRRTFFESYSVAVPRGAENIVATQNGSVLDGTLVSDPEFPAFSIYRFPLGTDLFSGQSTSVQVTYDHLGAPPRDPVPWRVNEAYAGFVALGLGDDGLVTVRISQPFGYEFDDSTDLAGFEASEPDAFGTIVHTRTGLDADDRITVGLADDDRLVSRPLGVPDADIQLRAWPDDPDWVDFAAVTVETGIPALEELLASRWPIENRLDVRETVEPNLRGYAGWFDRESNEIAVGEELDADTIYHELSHAWFNSAVSTERWFTEGLAQVYAAELVRRDGGSPRQPTPPAADAPGALALTDWASTVGGSDRDTEEYGYGTSFWVVDALVAEIGFDRTREVVNALRDGASAYDVAVTGERPDEDWQRVYDAIVEIGDAVTARDVFQARVVGPDGAGLIEARDRAATDVAGLAQRSSPWSLPLGVRSQLERWDLGEVDDSVLAANDVIERRSIVESLEEVAGIDEPDRAGDVYAAAPAPASGAVAFAEANSILDESIRLGDQLVDRQQRIVSLADPADVTPPDIGDLDGVEDFATGLEAADTQLLAVERIIELDERRASISGPLASIGRWGSDIDGDIDEARLQLESGNAEAALDTLTAAGVRIDDLTLTGAVRLTLVGALVIALLVVALVILRRQRRARDPVQPGSDN